MDGRSLDLDLTIWGIPCPTGVTVWTPRKCRVMVGILEKERLGERFGLSMGGYSF